ncbi:cytochrome P450 [Rhizobium sp. KVB221]|uniref:Cytochrome P450 n=1 Tax=Rhizobium setariae TaxID=2801340 RepID=A0A936YVL8_9HYPH|nr:cytochrome P450 [Rhizobium setariae]MBL0374202.1 cytochrome P450 [Rhizobium setariae]
MDIRPEPFEPPAPIPRTVPPSRLEIIRVMFRNPLELWGQPSYTLPYLQVKFFGQLTTIANHPGLIKHVLVDNASNYAMQPIRQLVLRPILRDGLLTAEGDVWKRSRKAMAPVFTPRHSRGFASQMFRKSEEFAERYIEPAKRGDEVNIATGMTELTYEILAETLFSGEIATGTDGFADRVDSLLHNMGRIDPFDLLRAPAWVPRMTRIPGRKALRAFRGIVAETMDARKAAIQRNAAVPDDFLTLLLRLEGPDGLTRDEIEDNILTFIGAGHETTARALAWTLYCVAESPHFRSLMEDEIDRVIADGADPVDWLDAMPHVRAAFEEALRLYPPAPSINRAPLEDDEWTDENGRTIQLPKGESVLVMPWTLHRHTLLWDRPRHFIPERFLPGNRETIGRFQYLPFGAGPRICIGATFALQEAVIALAVLMKRFRFDVTENTRPWPVQRLTTQPLNGIAMSVSAR